MFQLFILRGISGHIRSDNGPEFTAMAIRKWLTRLGVKTLFTEPGSPWENDSIEFFNGKLRDELFNREIFMNPKRFDKSGEVCCTIVANEALLLQLIISSIF